MLNTIEEIDEVPPRKQIETMYEILTVLISLYSQSAAGDHRVEGRRLWQKCIDSSLEDIETMHEIFYWRSEEVQFGMFLAEDPKITHAICKLFDRSLRIGELVTIWSFLTKTAKILMMLERQWQQVLSAGGENNSVDCNCFFVLIERSQQREKYISRLLDVYKAEQDSCRFLDVTSLQLDCQVAQLEKNEAFETEDSGAIKIHFHGTDLLAESVARLCGNATLERESGINSQPLRPRLNICELSDQKWHIAIEKAFAHEPNPLEVRVAIVNRERLKGPVIRWTCKSFGVAYIFSHDDIKNLREVYQRHLAEITEDGSAINYAVKIQKELRDKKLIEAEEYFQQFEQLECVPITIAIRQNYFRLIKEYRSEELFLHELLRDDNTQLWAASRLAMIMLKSGHYSYALELFARLNGYTKFNRRCLYLLGQMHIEMERFKKSIDYFQEGQHLFGGEIFNQSVILSNILAGDRKSIIQVAESAQKSYLFFSLVMMRSLQIARKKHFNRSLTLLQVCLFLAKSTSENEIALSVHNIIVCYIKMGRGSSVRKVLQDFYKKFIDLETHPIMVYLCKSLWGDKTNPSFLPNAVSFLTPSGEYQKNNFKSS